MADVRDGSETERLLELGRQRLAAADYAAAEAALLQALEAGDDAGQRFDVLRALVMCAFYVGRLEDALRRAMQARDVAAAAQDEGRLADAYNDLGLIHGRLGDYESALANLLDGLRLLRAQGRPVAASLHNNIGNVYLELRDHAQALEFFRAAHDAFRAQGARRGAAIALGNVGRAHAARGEPEPALAALRESLSLLDPREDAAYRAPALARLGGVHASLGDDAAARAALAEALAGAERQGEFLDEVLLVAGRFHLERAEHDAAIRLLGEALALLEPHETTPRALEVHRLLAEAFEQAGRLREALHHLKASHRIGAALSDAAVTVRLRGAMLAFDAERARQQEEIFRLKNVELARAYDELRTLHEALAARNDELQRISIEDALTGVFNRRYLDVQLSHEVSRALRRRRPLSVAMCDIDGFKQINDRLSHAMGDEVLRRLGRLLREVARNDDLVCRYGGEEFLIVLPETDVPGAVALAGRLRDAVRGHDWSGLDPDLRVTLSVGVARLGEHGDAERMLAEADARLYEAKRRGRDRVCA